MRSWLLPTRSVDVAPTTAIRGESDSIIVPAAQRIRNEKLKAIRLTLKMSQSEFATAVRLAGDAVGEPNTCTKRQVQKWESGTHAACQPSYRRALQNVTRTPYSELGFTDTAKVTASQLSISDLIGFSNTSPEYSLTLGEPSDAFRYALPRPEVGSPQAVSLITESTAYLFGLEYHRPARVMLPVVRQHIREIATMLTGTRHRPLRRRLTIAGGQAAALHGWLSYDLGDTAAAYRYWDSALAASRDAADRPLFACILTYLSYLATDQGDPHTAWQLAHTAISHAEPDARAQAWMAVRAAQEAAKIGDSGAALAELELALDFGREMAPAAPEDDAAPWCRFIDRAYVWAMASNVYTHLGAADDAYAAAVRAVDSLSGDQVKTRAIVLAEAAHAFARIGGAERAIRCATEAVDLADKLETTFARRRLSELLPLLAKGQRPELSHEIRKQLVKDKGSVGHQA